MSKFEQYWIFFSGWCAFFFLGAIFGFSGLNFSSDLKLFLDKYDTIATGMLAIVAAFIGGYFVSRANTKTLEKMSEQLDVMKQSHDLEIRQKIMPSIIEVVNITAWTVLDFDKTVGHLRSNADNEAQELFDRSEVIANELRGFNLGDAAMAYRTWTALLCITDPEKEVGAQVLAARKKHYDRACKLNDWAGDICRGAKITDIEF